MKNDMFKDISTIMADGDGSQYKLLSYRDFSIVAFMPLADM